MIDNLMLRTFPTGFIKDMKVGLLCNVAPEWHSQKLDSSLYYCSYNYVLPAAGIQDDCAVMLQAAFDADFFWMPQLTPEPGYIAQQHIYRTPALIFRGSGKTMILLPDIEVMQHQTVQSYLDMDAENRTMTLGLCKSKVVDHILYKKDRGAQFPAGESQIAFYLMCFQEELENPFRPVLEFYWDRYGRADSLRLLGTENNLDCYVEHTYRWAFENWKDVVWQEFEENGQSVGAPVFIVTTRQSPNYTGVKKEREVRSIWNQAWFSSLRSASGLFRYAKRTNSPALLEYANKTKELALAFPQRDGLFCSVIATEMETFDQNGELFMRSLGWDTRYWGNSDRNPFGTDVKHAPLHILDMSFTAYYMLLWYNELEKDERLLQYAGRYADRLLELQYDNGYFPSWVDEAGKSLGVLDNSPESAMTAAFLLLYGKVTGDSRFQTAALRCLDVIWQEVAPIGRWEDFETYWSCSAFWSDKVGQRISRNQMYKQCNFSMYFTALALLLAYETTQDQTHLTRGSRILDELLMSQSSYQPKSLMVPVVGGFGVLNTDAELNDARQSLFCELILRYGEHTGKSEYVERGLAALRISFSMMYCPENPEAKEQWEKAWPFLNEKDYGFNMENYGHNGVIDSQGLGIGEFTIYDWGNGAAAENYERLLARYHDQYFG